MSANDIKQGAYGKVPLIRTSSKLSILLRPSELVAAIRLKLQMRASKKARIASAAKSGDDDMMWCMHILEKVSRSFAGVIAQLPPELRRSVCIFYLVLRALDTVEDEMDLSRFTRYETDVDRVGGHGQGKGDEDDQTLRRTKVRLVAEFGWRLGSQTTKKSVCLHGIGEAHERELLEHFDRCMRVFKELPPKFQAVIHGITKRMGAGMAAYVGRDLRNGTDHTKDYNRYCEIVAGFVGEGLSELWVASGLEDATLTEDREAIYAMGLFLQKTNIIRDYLEDLTEGRTFWPKEIWSHHAETLAGLPREDPAGHCVQHMIADALLLLPACSRYLNRLKNPAIFRFCAIPQLMAVATLDHLQRHSPLVYRGVLKIRKGQAAWLITNVAQGGAVRVGRYMTTTAGALVSRISTGAALGSAPPHVLASITRVRKALRLPRADEDAAAFSCCSQLVSAQGMPNKWLGIGSVATAAVLGFTIRQILDGRVRKVLDGARNNVNVSLAAPVSMWDDIGLLDLDPVSVLLVCVSTMYLFYFFFSRASHREDGPHTHATDTHKLKAIIADDDDDDVSSPAMTTLYKVQEPLRPSNNAREGGDGDTTAAALVTTTGSKVDSSDSVADEEAHDLSKGAFLSACDGLRDRIVEGFARDHELGEEAVEWVRAMIDYTVKGGKMNRGLTVVHATRAMRAQRLSSAELEDATTLGWCIEWLQAFFLVADDVMDRSVTRRGQPCWYKRPQVKEVAINDAFILESCVFWLLRNRFRERPCYVRLLELFHEVTLQTELGQLLDLTSQPIDGKPDLRRFTAKRHQMIVRYKTAFYSFYLPVACSMVLNGITAESAYQKAKQICVIMGEYFQVQDDYLDCYGDPAVIGKVGTDIQDNKCSWLVVQALAHASPKQQEVLVQCYGKDDAAAVNKVKALYEDLGLEKLYLQYEEKSYTDITALIDTVQTMPHSVFHTLLKKIYKRSK